MLKVHGVSYYSKHHTKIPGVFAYLLASTPESFVVAYFKQLANKSIIILRLSKRTIVDLHIRNIPLCLS